jgi:hypothetical protein
MSSDPSSKEFTLFIKPTQRIKEFSTVRETGGGIQMSLMSDKPDANSDDDEPFDDIEAMTTPENHTLIESPAK